MPRGRAARAPDRQMANGDAWVGSYSRGSKPRAARRRPRRLRRRVTIGRMKRAAWLAGLVLVMGSSVAAAEAPPRDIDELRARIARVLLREHVPGAGIALIDGDQVVWAGGVGVADRATRRP